MIRLSLGYMGVGFTLGALLQIHKGIGLSPALWAVLPAHIELLLIGWIVQLSLGMGFWILPRIGHALRRGNVAFATGGFWMLNLGIWVYALSTIPQVPAWWGFVGRGAEAAGILAFLHNAWTRINR
jgi:hypothetical protein